jgi:hypothetical protein
MIAHARSWAYPLIAVGFAGWVLIGCSDHGRSPLPSEPSGGGERGLIARAMPDTTTFAKSLDGKLRPELSVIPSNMAAAHPEFRIAVVGGDTTNEMCRSNEFCAIQGQAAGGFVAVLCAAGPGACQSASYEWSIQDSPSHSSTTFTPDTTVTDQFARVSIQTTDSTPPEMYLVTFVPTPLPGFPPPNPLTVQGVVHVLCSFKHQTCPKVEIVDHDKGDSVVSLPENNPATRTTLIGKPMKLLVRATDTTEYTLQQAAWALFVGGNGDIVKHFDLALGQLQNLTVPDDLSDPELSYYYAVARDGYPLAVEALVTANDNPDRVFFPEAGANYDLKGPTSVVMTSATTTVIVGSVGGDTSQTLLSFGDPTLLPGIQFQFTATAPPGDNGYVAGTQLVQKETTSSPAGTWQNTGGSFWLDACPIYAAVQTGIAGPPGANHQFIWRASDSPFTELVPAFTLVTRSDIFRMHFMYRPAGTESIWVPIGKLDWFWNGTATRNGNPLVNHGWTGPTNSTFSASPIGSTSSDFPQWGTVLSAPEPCPTLPTQ